MSGWHIQGCWGMRLWQVKPGSQTLGPLGSQALWQVRPSQIEPSGHGGSPLLHWGKHSIQTLLAAPKTALHFWPWEQGVRWQSPP